VTESDHIGEYRRQGQAKIQEEAAVFGGNVLENQGCLLEFCEGGEAGDAELFVHLNKDRLVYDHAAGEWVQFTGGHWKSCEINEPLALAGNLIGIYAAEAEKASFRRLNAVRNGDERAAKAAAKVQDTFLRKITILRRRQHRTNVLTLAAAGDQSLGISGRQWDTKPLLLPCLNGVLDLETGDFRDVRPTDYIRKYSPVAWAGFDAPAPRWGAFVHEILGDDLEKAAFLKRLLGSSITGEVNEAVFPVLWGAGRNGKTVLLEILAYVLGPLAGPVQSELLMQQKFPRSAAAPSPDIMAFRGLRLVWASENSEGKYLDSGKLKWLTGGDSLVGRGPYDKRMIVFKPTHSLLLVTNFRPAGNPQDEALWARVLSIRFPFSYVDSPIKENERARDPQLADDLKKEAPGILAWLVEGFYAWQEKGLAPPPSIQMETVEYRRSDDSVTSFIETCCVIADGKMARSTDLHDAYTSFCEEEGFKPKGKKRFLAILHQEFTKKRDKIGNYFNGIGLKET
jgi:putative DNA primase/helicase